MWISLEKRLVELWFHENLLGRFHWKTVDVNGMHNLSNMTHSSAWKWAIPVVDDHSIIRKRMEPAQVWSRAVERQGLLWTHQGDATAGWSGWQVLGSWGSLVTGNILCSHRSDMFQYVSVWSTESQEFSVDLDARSKLDRVIVWSCLVLVFLALRCDFGCPGRGGFQEEEGHACEGHLHWLRQATSPKVWETYHPQLVHQNHSGSQS